MCQPHSSHQTLLQGAVTDNDTAKLLPPYISLPAASRKRLPPRAVGLLTLSTSLFAPKVFSVLFGEFPVFSLLPVLSYSVCPVFKNGLFVSPHWGSGGVGRWGCVWPKASVLLSQDGSHNGAWCVVLLLPFNNSAPFAVTLSAAAPLRALFI